MGEETGYDSRPETHEHIRQVQILLHRCALDLLLRSTAHDRSKLEGPEREVFDEFTPKLRGTTYGSEEYRGYLAAMKPALDHHYAANDHHPEHFGEAGVRRMHLLQLVEMLCDWLAATKRHADGDIRCSIEINQKRFGYSDELKQILLNTLPLLETPP